VPKTETDIMKERVMLAIRQSVEILGQDLFDNYRLQKRHFKALPNQMLRFVYRLAYMMQLLETEPKHSIRMGLPALLDAMETPADLAPDSHSIHDLVRECETQLKKAGAGKLMFNAKDFEHFRFTNKAMIQVLRKLEPDI